MNLKICLWVIVLSLGFYIDTFAVEEKCDLNFRIIESNQSISGVPKLLDGVNLSFINIESGKKITSEDGKFTIPNLKTGKYILTASKDGFKTSLRMTEHICKSTTPDVEIQMWNGSSKEKINIIDSDNSSLFKVPSKITLDKPNFIALNHLIRSWPKPQYPAAAKAVRASGSVFLYVTVAEDGTVSSAKAIAGHPLLQRAAEESTKEAQLWASMRGNTSEKIEGILVMNFTTGF